MLVNKVKTLIVVAKIKSLETQGFHRSKSVINQTLQDNNDTGALEFTSLEKRDHLTRPPEMAEELLSYRDLLQRDKLFLGKKKDLAFSQFVTASNLSLLTF